MFLEGSLIYEFFICFIEVAYNKCASICLALEKIFSKSFAKYHFLHTFALYHRGGTLIQIDKLLIMIQINDVTFGYSAGKNVFDRLNLSLSTPGIYGLLGLNGSGKTTLLNLLSSLIFADQGGILIDGQDVTKRETSTLEKIYYMPSEMPETNMTFKDFIKNYSPLYPYFNKEVLQDCLKQFQVNTDERISDLSLGGKKKVFISFAIAVGAELLLMDEPTNGLDIPSKKIFRQLLMRHVSESQQVIISTHLVGDVANLLDHFIILKDNGKVFSASAAEITEKFAFVRQLTNENVLYAEPCAEGYKVIKPNEGEETDIDIELLFDAIIEGGLS